MCACVCACHVLYCVNVGVCVCVPTCLNLHVCLSYVCMHVCVCSQCLFTMPTLKESQSHDAHTCTLPSSPSSLAAPLPFQVCERSEEQSCYQRLDIYRMVCMCTCVSVMLPRAHLHTFATVSGASARRFNPHTQARVRSSGPANLS